MKSYCFKVESIYGTVKYCEVCDVKNYAQALVVLGNNIQMCYVKSFESVQCIDENLITDVFSGDVKDD